jgi:hypothetical protein
VPSRLFQLNSPLATFASTFTRSCTYTDAHISVYISLYVNVVELWSLYGDESRWLGNARAIYRTRAIITLGVTTCETVEDKSVERKVTIHFKSACVLHSSSEKMRVMQRNAILLNDKMMAEITICFYRQ